MRSTLDFEGESKNRVYSVWIKNVIAEGKGLKKFYEIRRKTRFQCLMVKLY